MLICYKNRLYKKVKGSGSEGAGACEGCAILDRETNECPLYLSARHVCGNGVLKEVPNVRIVDDTTVQLNGVYIFK